MPPTGNDLNRRLVRLAVALQDRFNNTPFRKLTPTEQVFHAIWELEADVNNGGFNQFIFNSSGHLLPRAAEALESIGASAMAAIARAAIQVVGPDFPWPDRYARQDRLLDLPDSSLDQLGALDQKFWTYPDNLTVLLHAFVCAHPDEIALPDDFCS